MLATKLTGEADGEGAVAAAGANKAAAAAAPVVYALTAGDEMQGDAAGAKGDVAAGAAAEPDGSGSTVIPGSAPGSAPGSQADEDEYRVGADEDQEDDEVGLCKCSLPHFSTFLHIPPHSSTFQPLVS